MLSIDVNSSRELQAVVLALKDARKDVQSIIRDQTRRVVVPEWQKGLTSRVETRMESRLAQTGRAKVSQQNVTLTAGTVRGSKSADMRLLNKPVEFGAGQTKVSTYRRKNRKSPGTHEVTRHTTHQFRPPRRGGYVVYPTAKNLVPRIASLWVQTVVRGMHDIFEGGRF